MPIMGTSISELSFIAEPYPRESLVEAFKLIRAFPHLPQKIRLRLNMRVFIAKPLESPGSAINSICRLY